MIAEQSWIAFVALLRCEVRRFLRLWTQTLLPPVITMSLYFIIFGHLVGSQLHSIEGFTYMQYITPGLIMMPVVMNAYMNTVSSFYLLRFQRSIDELTVSPMSNMIILCAFMIGGALRGLMVGILVMGMSLFFTHLSLHHILWMLVSASLTAVLFSLLGFMNGVFARNFDDIAIIPTFVLTPLTYLGGVFYSIHMLPSFWQTVSYFNPIFYMVNALRYGLLGISDVPVGYGVLIMLLCSVVVFGLNLMLLKKGVGIRT